LSEIYDYIVIGSGSAGAVVASRLSEDKTNQVLLLEVGGRDTKAEIHVPFYHPKLLKTDVDWFYYTEPEPHLNFRRIYWPRGKVLGGCSSCNFMIVQRGHRDDFDRWDQLGNKGWSYADILPTLKKMENHFSGTSEYHGVGGPVNVTRLKCVNPLSHLYLEAAVASGIARTDDQNGPLLDGADYVQVSQKDGQRSSVVKGYLEPARERKNLTVKTQAYVTRLLVEKGRAEGVSYLKDGEIKKAQASREVILCGGTINSPQLLMLSGIGPADHLKSLGIPVVQELPGVGQNLQDHFLTPVNYHCTQPVSLANAEIAENRDLYMSSHDGPLTSNLVEAIAFYKTRTGLKTPDVVLNFIPNFFQDYGFRNYDGHAFTVSVNLRQTESKGQITLASNDPFASPRIQVNYLSQGSEVKSLIQGIRFAREIIRNKAFDPYRGIEIFPGDSIQTDQEISDYIRSRGHTEFHPVSTCKMGNDAMAVVDSRLRVRGVEGLRVADASVFPAETISATNITTIMIGERAAAMIREGR
jgi:choline dehydrogenase